MGAHAVPVACNQGSLWEHQDPVLVTLGGFSCWCNENEQVVYHKRSNRKITHFSVPRLIKASWKNWDMKCKMGGSKSSAKVLEMNWKFGALTKEKTVALVDTEAHYLSMSKMTKDQLKTRLGFLNELFSCSPLRWTKTCLENWVKIPIRRSWRLDCGSKTEIPFWSSKEDEIQDKLIDN